ncbi:hypothetical protein R6Q59_001871 [Mikania micrantha]
MFKFKSNETSKPKQVFRGEFQWYRWHVTMLLGQMEIMLVEAMMKDTLERATEPNLNLKGYLENAYLPPIFKEAESDSDDDDDDEISDKKWAKDNVLVATKRQSRKSTPVPSKISNGSSPNLLEIQEKDKP